MSVHVCVSSTDIKNLQCSGHYVKLEALEVINMVGLQCFHWSKKTGKCEQLQYDMLLLCFPSSFVIKSIEKPPTNISSYSNMHLYMLSVF
jgi:hypothetical protein